ncbi:hypothetical protein Dimus_003470 [Dionaea muscipula]
MTSSRGAFDFVSPSSSLPLQRSFESPGWTVEGRRDRALRSLGLHRRSPSPQVSRGRVLYSRPGVELSLVLEVPDSPANDGRGVEESSGGCVSPIEVGLSTLEVVTGGSFMDDRGKRGDGPKLAG